MHHAARLPSLNALQAFEAAARHESFTRAARELGVTQTAISHQVKALELELGVPLFRRSPRRLTLTPAGKAWAAELLVVFQRLRDTNVRLRATAGAHDRTLIAVSVVPSFGARWLVPRLGRFMDHNPEIDVRISASERLIDFGLEPFDLGIRYGSGHYPGLFCEKLADDAWVVVCAPGLLQRLKVKVPADLSRSKLLCDDHPKAWETWFAAMAEPGPRTSRSTELTDSSMLVEAALRAQGVALARWSLACDELESGNLLQVFPKLPRVPTGLSYYLVGPRENLHREPVAIFRDWIRKEVASL